MSLARKDRGLIGPAAGLRLPWRFLLRGVVGVTLMLALMLRVFVGQLVVVRGDLMAPLVHDGDVLIVRHARVPTVGDVVLIDLGDDKPARLRRVLARPGDQIGSRQGAFLRNGRAHGLTLVGPYVWSQTDPDGATARRQQLYTEDAPEGARAVLGDHLGAARPWRLHLPEVEVPPGMLFVLCDNRRECPADETAGLVPAIAVIGIADAFLWYGPARSRTEARQPLYGGLVPVMAAAAPPVSLTTSEAAAPASSPGVDAASESDAALSRPDATVAPASPELSPSLK